jgi:DNA-binding SARP family transcriptional activator/TolB-like protein
MELKTFGGLTLIGTDGQVIPAQRRRLGLLTVIALAGQRGVSRERLLGLFWGETDEERGRAALAQALYALRRTLGRDDLFAGTANLTLTPGALVVDALALEDDLRAGRMAEAAARYAGPFLDGFYLTEAPEFERWVDEVRGRYAHSFQDALERTAAAADAAGRPADALPHWRRLATLDPTNPRAVMGLMRSAAASGDMAAALRHARVYAQLLEADDITPDPVVEALAEELKRGTGTKPLAAPPSFGTTIAAPDRRVSPAAPGSTTARPLSRISPSTIAVIAVSVAVTAVALALGIAPRGANRDAVYVVGRILDHSGEPTGVAVAEMLTTSLARVSGLSVVSTARMYELTAGDTARVLAAARRAGATVLLDGALFRPSPSQYRLELRRIGVDNGRVLGADRIDAADVFGLVDSATAVVAAQRGAAPPTTPLAEQTTSSLAAYRLYSEGVRLHFTGQTERARALLDAAVREDSTFALAWLWGAKLNSDDYRQWRPRAEQAMALASRVPERERLLIELEWANRQDSPIRLALAESLAVRYPSDAATQLELGAVLQWDGQFLAAEKAFARTIELDRGGLASTPGQRCVACEAMWWTSAALRLADSTDAAIRAMRRWTRAAPASADAWYNLADVLMQAGRIDEAYAAERVAAPLDRPERSEAVRALITLFSEDWAAAAELFARDAARADRAIQDRGIWLLMIARRHQGRLDDALALARRYIEIGGIPSPEAQVLYERGEHRSAAQAFRAIASAPPQDAAPSRRAREIAWYLTHTATALAAAGDTASLLPLADSIETLGRQTAYGRDRRLHHHVRGVLYAARGRRQEAIESFQRAIFSPTGGYTRTNYELARVLIEAGRPKEAVRVLQPVLRAGLDASNLYLTRTDVRALLGRAFEAAGQPDSAAVQYRRVIAAWAHADTPVAKRRRELEARLSALPR